MGNLYLIRHGQASFGSDDYDVLTPHGEAQARTLGDSLAKTLHHLDAVFSGPARRHQETCHLALHTASEAGLSHPEPIVLTGLDEFPGVELFKRALPTLPQLDPELAELVARGMPSDPKELDRALGRAAERLTTLWASGALDAHGLERIDDFEARVSRAIDHIIERCGRGAVIAVFTSAGPIAMAVKRALDLSTPRALELLRTVANVSVTELRYRGSELGLITFNCK